MKVDIVHERGDALIATAARAALIAVQIDTTMRTRAPALSCAL